jgi:hypothetical protein
MVTNCSGNANEKGYSKLKKAPKMLLVVFRENLNIRGITIES